MTLDQAAPTAAAAGRTALRAVVVNHWHDDNKGDSAITMVTLHLLEQQFPGVEIELVSILGADDPAFGRSFRHIAARFPHVRTRASHVASLGSGGNPSLRQVLAWAASIGWSAVSLAFGRPPRSIATAIGAADVLVLAGGSNLFDTGRRPPLGTLRLLQCLLPAFVARRSNLPYILLGHTLGPVRTRIGRRLLRTIVRDAALVVVREVNSAGFVERDLGLPSGNVRIAPDVAFALPAASTARLDGVLDGFGDARFAVLVPRSYHHPDPERDARLAEQMGALGRDALERGLVDAVVVFPQCLGPTPIEDDRIIATEIVAANPTFRLVVADLDPGEVAGLYRHATFVVAVRLHAVILALTVGTPVHGIEYFTNKTRGVFASVGLDEHWSQFDRFDAGHALAKVEELLTEASRSMIRGRVASMRAGVLDIAIRDVVAAIPRRRGASSWTRAR